MVAGVANKLNQLIRIIQTLSNNLAMSPATWKMSTTIISSRCDSMVYLKMNREISCNERNVGMDKVTMQKSGHLYEWRIKINLCNTVMDFM